MTTKFATTHNDWDPHQAIPLTVHPHGEKIYVDPTWGVKLEQVTADGKVVAPVDWDALRDDINFNKIPIGDELFIYLVQRHSLVFAKTFDEKGEFELIKYTLPQGAKQVIFEYRLRETPATIGPKLTLISNLV